MRVTNKLMADNAAGNLFTNAARLLKIQEMISSGKRINRPSDDPIGMGKVLDFRTTIASLEQYNRNILHGRAWLEQTDSTLDAMGTIITRAKELAVYQATETSSAQTRDITAEEIKNLYDQLIQLGNSQYRGSYIFAGYLTSTQPFSRDGSFNATYAGDTGEIGIVTGENTSVAVNVNGQEVLMGGVNVFNVLRDLITGLESNDTAQISNQIEPLGQALSQILDARATVGARLNRLETAENHWENFKVNVTKILSGTEDTDIPKAMTDLLAQESCYQAALATSARVIQPTLIDFLK